MGGGDMLCKWISSFAMKGRKPIDVHSNLWKSQKLNHSKQKNLYG